MNRNRRRWFEKEDLPDWDLLRPPPSATRAHMVDLFVEAVITGAYCPLMDVPGEMMPKAAISPDGLNTLTKLELWPRTMRAVARIEDPHPHAQRRFLRSWAAEGWKYRGLVGNDDVYFRAMRVLLPPYRGRPKVLFRGGLAGMWSGMSWTSDFTVAERYATMAVTDEDWSEEEFEKLPDDYVFRMPRHLMRLPIAMRKPIVLRAVMRDEIIARIPEQTGFYRHDEYAVDPRGVDYQIIHIQEIDPRL